MGLYTIIGVKFRGNIKEKREPTSTVTPAANCKLLRVTSVQFMTFDQQTLLPGDQITVLHTL